MKPLPFKKIGKKIDPDSLKCKWLDEDKTIDELKLIDVYEIDYELLEKINFESKGVD